MSGWGAERPFQKWNGRSFFCAGSICSAIGVRVVIGDIFRQIGDSGGFSLD
jgi:hypothetical protein